MQSQKESFEVSVAQIKKTFEEATAKHQSEKADMQTKLKEQMATMVKMKQLEIELNGIKQKHLKQVEEG